MGWTTERARIAWLSRDRDPDDPDLIQARLDYAATPSPIASPSTSPESWPKRRR